MNLWIRSQDKEILMKIDNINLGLDVDSNEPCRLFTFVGGAVTSFTLGIYRSKERALEVLDEIDKYKNKLEKAHFLGMEESGFVSSTFQMPKE